MTTNRSIGKRLCLALILATGFALVSGTAIGWAYGTARALFGQESAQFGPQLIVLSGQPAIERGSYKDREWTYTYRSLAGTPIKGPVKRENIMTGNSLWPHPPAFAAAGPGLRSRVTVAATTGAEHWYYVAYRMGTDGLAYFCGYDTQSRQSVGFFGRNGFQPDAPTPEEMLPVNTGRTYEGTFFNTWVNTQNTLRTAHFFVLSGGRLIQIDPATRSMTPVVDRADIVDAAPLGTTTWSTLAGVNVRAQPILLRTPGSVIVFDPASETSREYALPAECRDRLITFVPIDEEQAAVEAWSGAESDAIEQSDVLLFNSQGELQARCPDALDRDVWTLQRGDLLLTACIVPAPIVTMLLTAMAPLNTTWLSTTWGAVLWQAWPAFVLTCIVGLLAAWVARRHLRHSGGTRAALWTAFVFLFGLPGYVGYRLHRRFPRREPIPPPERLGYEILA